MLIWLCDRYGFCRCWDVLNLPLVKVVGLTFGSRPSNCGEKVCEEALGGEKVCCGGFGLLLLLAWAEMRPRCDGSMLDEIRCR